MPALSLHLLYTCMLKMDKLLPLRSYALEQTKRYDMEVADAECDVPF